MSNVRFEGNYLIYDKKTKENIESHSNELNAEKAIEILNNHETRNNRVPHYEIKIVTDKVLNDIQKGVSRV